MLRAQNTRLEKQLLERQNETHLNGNEQYV